MKYIITFLWAFMLTQMLNFIINALNGGGPLNIWIGVAFAALITLTMYILGAMLKSHEDHHDHTHTY